MRELLGWKLNLRRVRGIQVSLHVFFILFAFFWLISCYKLQPQGLPWQHSLVWYGAVGLLLLMISVLLHEFGHAIAARGVGGECSEILLVPWGGLAHVDLPRWGRDEHTAAQHELIVSIAGPLVNLLICLVTVPLLILLHVSPVQLLSPLVPPADVHPGSGWSPLVFTLSMLFWLNWVLLLFNLLPAFPMDGGRILRAMLWKGFGHRAAVTWSSIIGQLTAGILLIVGIVLPEQYAFAQIPLILVSVFIFVSARAELQRQQEPTDDDSFLGYDFSQGYTSLERDVKAPPEPKPGVIKQWLENRRLAKIENQRKVEAEEEARLDEVLARLHEVGRDGLSEEDRRLLERVSERYRSRMQG